MIDSQVRTNDVSDLALQDAVRSVPRELFVPESSRAFAYAEIEIPTAPGRVLWKSRDFTKLAQAAGVFAGDHILIIAGASGYSAAVFAAMGAHVTILEETEDLASGARVCLEAAGTIGVTVICGELKAGVAGPFDLIFVDGAVEIVPSAWVKELAEGGRLAVVVTAGPMAKARVYVRSGDASSSRDIFDCNVPALGGFSKEQTFTF